MEKMVKAIQYFDFKINNDNILFFDMDGTLVDTNLANYLAYKNAIQSVTKSDIDIPYNPNKRFNRGALKNIIPSLTDYEYEKIIQEKEQYYENYLSETKLNKLVVEILVQYSNINKTVLVTNCREKRALMTLNYYGLTDKFSNLFYLQSADNEKRINKYEKAISNLEILAQSVIVFENEQSEINDAILAGIPIKNILIL
jgi:beta-phosphoglucomutase-like phosphatase (HAD superfamily)